MKLFIAVSVCLVALQCVDAFSSVKMLCLVNRERTKRGLASLGHNAQLDQAATYHSQMQARYGQMAHQVSGEASPSQRLTNFGYKWTKMAENVAYGYKDEEECVRQWMNSPGHRANILGDFLHFGAGVAKSGSTPYYTQSFGRTSRGGEHYPECPDDSIADAPAPWFKHHDVVYKNDVALDSDDTEDTPASVTYKQSNEEPCPTPY